MNHRRLERLERWRFAQIEHLAQEAGAPYGLSGAEVLDEGRRFLALSDEEQDRELATCRDQLQAEGRLEEVTIIEDAWAAIKRDR